MDYREFLKSKQADARTYGFEPVEFNEHLKPFQRWIVDRAVRAGKYAIWANCGLGKTLMQLEWARQVVRHTGKPVLILAPLGVVGQTLREAAKFGIEAGRIGDQSGIDVTNYEQLDNVNPSNYVGVVLDESSILKSVDGATKKQLIDGFRKTKYKLCCTATPSPNDPMELGNHSEMLDVMSNNELLAMYFVHDGGETAKWRIKGHAEKAFYEFISTWAVMISKPSDIGFSDEGYDLPPLNITERQIKTPKRDNGALFNDEAVSATNFNAELRLTKLERMDQVAEIVNGSSEQFIIWVKQNEEAELITRMIHGAVNVHGGQSPEEKEAKLLGFANGDFRVLVTKSKIAQFGLNFQNCHNQVFASLDFSFEALYQSIRRSYRFGQMHAVNIYLITTDTMANVIEAIKTKQAQFDKLQSEMRIAITSNIKGIKLVDKSYNIEKAETEYYSIQRGDCVELIRDVPDDSVGLSVFSPPFADLYTYSAHVEDMGNSKDYKEFMIQFGFLVSELYRVIKPGRNVAVHCMDLPVQKGKHGYIGIRDFSGMILAAFESAGFIYHSRVTIWKNPVVEMQRTKALGLLHKQVKKDSTMSRVGIPDYVMIFRKDGDRVDPVRNEDVTVDQWQKWASPVWMDIDYGNTLQGVRDCREDSDEKHICPLQLDTIQRLIALYTNPGDTVLTPFMGIGSEVYQAVKMGRYGIGFELKESYYDQARKNIELAVSEKSQVELFA